VCVRSSTSQPLQNESSDVKVVVEKVEKVSSDEAHFWLKVVNGSISPVFIEAHPFDTRILEDIWIQQWSADKGWHTIAPCLDTSPSGIYKLKQRDSIAQESVLINPLNSICRERYIQIEGKFRFLVNYFLSEKEARTNEKNYFSSGHPPPHTVVSEPFEIPPLKK
jgi:hypothetical protein